MACFFFFSNGPKAWSECADESCPSVPNGVCSRTAIVKYQNILVDSSNSKKGEGLRFIIEKDSIAKNYLDAYQEKTQMRWLNALIGTTGTLMFFSGLTKTGSFKDSGITSKRSLMIGGAAVIMINYLIIKTLNYSSEALLLRSIEEYNKRNMPQIYFAPQSSLGPNASGMRENIEIGASFTKTF
jgi:hypothetical protein